MARPYHPANGDVSRDWYAIARRGLAAESKLKALQAVSPEHHWAMLGRRRLARQKFTTVSIDGTGMVPVQLHNSFLPSADMAEQRVPLMLNGKELRSFELTGSARVPT